MIIHAKDMNGIQEVSGSIPLISTTKNPVIFEITGFFRFKFFVGAMQ